MIILAVAGVLALGFVAFAVTGALLGTEPTAGPTPTPPPSAPATPQPPPTSASRDPEPSSAPPTEPSPTPVEPTPQPTPNDGYDPPPLPQPETYEEADQWLVANALYPQSAVEHNCALPRLADPKPPDLATFDAHLALGMDCLMLVWQAPMDAAGFQFPRPPVRSYDQPITTACGTSPSMEQAAAFYCPGDQRIFYAVDRQRPLFLNTSLEIEGTLGHELGHAIQGRNGILWSEAVMAHNQEKAVVLEYSRRRELQATCLGGLALNSLAAATGLNDLEREALKLDAYLRGDHPARDRTHGTAESGLRWMADGLATLDAGACNTFAVPASEVE